MGYTEIGLAIFVIAVIVSRIVLQKANGSLSVEEKAKLVDSLGGLLNYGIVLILPIVGIYWYLLRTLTLASRCCWLATSRLR